MISTAFGTFKSPDLCVPNSRKAQPPASGIGGIKNRAMSFFHLAACMVIALRLTPKDPQLQDATALGLGFLWHL